MINDPDHKDNAQNNAQLDYLPSGRKTREERIAEVQEAEANGNIQDLIDAITQPAQAHTQGSQGNNQAPQPVKLDLGKIMEYVELTEMGDAACFADCFRDKVIYDTSNKDWYLWADHHWEPDTTWKIKHYVAYDLKDEYNKLAAELDTQKIFQPKYQTPDYGVLAKEIRNKTKTIGKRHRVDNILSLVPSQPGMSIPGNKWDNNIGYLAVENGVIDLHTGEIKDGKQQDYIRAYAPTEYKGLQEDCPHWKKYLSEILNNDKELFLYLQVLFGYALTGEVKEHIFPILHGEHGRNGKSTLFETLQNVLGTGIVSRINTDVLMDFKRSGDTPQPTLLGLQNKRLIFAQELNEDRKINEALVKLLSGGDTISARGLHSNPVTFKPRHTIFLSVNTPPHASSNDDALWERIKIINFPNRYIENPSRPNEYLYDNDLKNKLSKERSGILAWLINGSIRYYQNGLEVPSTVKNQTKEYRKSEDDLLPFFEEACVIDPSFSITAKDLYIAYRFWAQANGEKVMSNTAFGRKIKDKFEKIKTVKGNCYNGVTVK